MFTLKLSPKISALVVKLDGAIDYKWERNCCYIRPQDAFTVLRHLEEWRWIDHAYRWVKC